jgi:phospholipase/carboxylesterase
MTEKLVNAPEFFPVSGGKPKQIVIMLHGVGADGENLMGLAYEFCRTLPDAYFTAPNAPYAYDGGFGGYQWFSLWDRSPQELLKGVNNILPIIKDFIDEKCAQFNLGYEDVVLLGFSQGCMTALHTALRLPHKLAGVLGYSGTMVALEPQPGEITAKPPICLIHGKLDEVVSAKFSSIAYQMLKKLGVEVTHHEIDGLGHSIDLNGVEIGKKFLQEVFPSSAAAA